MVENRIQLLECTIRDGGLGLEDAWVNEISNTKLSYKERHELGEIIASIDSDIIEIGSLQRTADDRKGFAIYQTIEEASEYIPDSMEKNQMSVVMVRDIDYPVEKIPARKEKMVDGLRVVVRYSEIVKSLEFCKKMSECGYKVFIQPMVTARYSEEELNLLVKYANDMDAYALYFVDSYGYMMPEDVIKYMTLFDEGLKPGICIGFHAHNNMNMAFTNAISFLKYSTKRRIIIDSTCTGMGQGAGNLQTEVISDYLNKSYNKKYDYEEVLKACDFVEKYNHDGLWGYSVMRLIPAVHGVAYKYAIYLRKVYGLSYVEIDKLLQLLSTMSTEMQHRYSKENVSKLLSAGGFTLGDKL